MAKPSEETMENSTPESIKGWNWGAFFLHGIWGIGNKTYIALFAFVPVINIPVMIFLGLKGNEMSWKNKEWGSIEDFKSTQRIWNIAGFAAFAVYILVIILEFSYILFS